MQIDATVSAVVVGGASGMGAATVRALTGRGAWVAILDRNVTLGQALATETGARIFEANVTDEASVFAAKAAINGMTPAMARDLAPEAIPVNTILPGNFETPLIGDVPDDYKAAMRSWNLHPRRFGHPDEYAGMALQVIENGYLNAALLRIDGGARN